MRLPMAINACAPFVVETMALPSKPLGKPTSVSVSDGSKSFCSFRSSNGEVVAGIVKEFHSERSYLSSNQRQG